MLESQSKMAVSSDPCMKLELPSKPLQELLKTSAKQVPERYIYHKLSDIQSQINYMESCVISLSRLSSSSSHQQQDELRKLRTILNSWGCFQLIDHGLSSSLLNKIREVGKEFFDLPLERKQKHRRTLDRFEGYGDDTVSEDQSYNWNDRLTLKVHPFHHRNFMLWPQCLPIFRETLEEYTMELKRVLQIVVKAIAKSLDLEDNIFLKQFGGEDTINMFARFNYYPPCEFPDHVLGLKPHSDSTALTILLQDEQVEGLQVQKDDQWFKIPVTPHALFINIGDLLEIMSNGILKSVVHKVVVDKERERATIAMLCIPQLDGELGPLAEFIDEERPQKYKEVNNYLGLFIQYYSRGERVITALKI